MTVSEARAELARPLVFGDARQIKARQLLEQLEECKEAIRACPNDHLKGTRFSRHCECVRKWAPELEESRGGDWSIIHAALAEVRR